MIAQQLLNVRSKLVQYVSVEKYTLWQFISSTNTSSCAYVQHSLSQSYGNRDLVQKISVPQLSDLKLDVHSVHCVSKLLLTL